MGTKDIMPGFLGVCEDWKEIVLDPNSLCPSQAVKLKEFTFTGQETDKWYKLIYSWEAIQDTQVRRIAIPLAAREKRRMV